MPFTLAHPAAAIPLSKVLGSRASLSALVIGSMIPDIVYFFPLGINGRVSHSLAGLVWFCIPAGLLAFLLFHAIVKRPAATLLPLAITRRLRADTLDGPVFGQAAPATVLLSLGLGAFTHIAWDAFTHSHTEVVQNLELLRTVVGAIGGYQVRLYKVLQYISSVAGLLALAFWTYEWVRSHPPACDADRAASLPFRIRVLVIGMIAGTALAYGVFKGAAASFGSFEFMLVRALVGGLRGLAFSCAVFCLGWHLYFAYRNRYA